MHLSWHVPIGISDFFFLKNMTEKTSIGEIVTCLPRSRSTYLAGSGSFIPGGSFVPMVADVARAGWWCHTHAVGKESTPSDVLGGFSGCMNVHLDVHINVYMSFLKLIICMYIWIWICIYMSHMRFHDEFWPNCTKSCIDTLTPLSRRLCQRPTRSIEGRCGKDPFFCRQVLHDMMTWWHVRIKELAQHHREFYPTQLLIWLVEVQLDDLCNGDLTSSETFFVFECLQVYLYIVVFGLIWYTLV